MTTLLSRQEFRTLPAERSARDQFGGGIRHDLTLVGQTMDVRLPISVLKLPAS